MDIKELAKEVFNELMSELDAADSITPSKNDIQLGGDAAKLAQLKGELSTILGKAERAGAIKRANGKVTIINKEYYGKIIGDLPKRIKALQQSLEPDTNYDTQF